MDIDNQIVELTDEKIMEALKERVDSRMNKKRTINVDILNRILKEVDEIGAISSEDCSYELVSASQEDFFLVFDYIRESFIKSGRESIDDLELDPINESFFFVYNNIRYSLGIVWWGQGTVCHIYGSVNPEESDFRLEIDTTLEF